MLPEVEEFMTTKREADEALQYWYDNGRKDQPERKYDVWDYEYQKYREAYAEWDKKYRAAHTENHERYRAVMGEARKVLRTKTRDPIIRWMLTSIEDYDPYIETVLPILPATREQLEELATQNDWCSQFDHFMEEATKAGILPPADPSEPDVSELVQWIADETDEYPRNIRRRVQGMVNKIVEKALADKEAENAAKHNEAVTV